MIGNCFGPIDSVARYRKKLWKSLEGNRPFLRLKQHTVVPPYFHIFPVIYRNHLVPLIFYIFDFVLLYPGYCSKWAGPPYVSYILKFLIYNKLIVPSSSLPPRGIYFWGFPKYYLILGTEEVPPMFYLFKNNNI